jgi:diadenosine tetraphosphatase ApaH/serine/threonine PP2A family protein phosphatase
VHGLEVSKGIMAERIAIISDIHANLEALEAVFADIDAYGAGEVLCLGDIVGYGVEAEACVDLVQKRCSLCLCGNHDWAMVNTAAGFNPMARQAIEYTRRRMQPGPLAGRARQRRWEFVKGLPHTHERGNWLLVHGSPRDPVMEYIFPEDVDIAPEKMAEIFGMFERVCFVGHTHLPGVFTEDLRFLTPAEVSHGVGIGSQRAVVNVGSVGQPRDGDVRACYVQVSDGVAVYRRVEYDIQKAMEKIRASQIDAVCAERLALGK